MPSPQTEIPPVEIPGEKKYKHRHGCLTAYLLFMLVASVAAIIIYLACVIRPGFLAPIVDQVKSGAGLPNWAYPVFALMGALELICTVALYKWKRWGFWGFCGVAVLIFVVYAALYKISSAFSGLIGVLVLLAVLFIGNEDDRGWPQLD